MKSSSFRKDKLILFLTGCALGAACFLWVYGARILNPLYDAWLFNTDIDLKQHYIGFCHYRMSPWHFPIGLIDTLSYPVSMSVIYTDSIPLFAFVFKLLSPVLPLDFQYFGIFGIMCFMLMGGYSSLLVHTLIKGSILGSSDDNIARSRFAFVDRNLALILSAVCSVVFILSSTVLQRMFYHTSLAAQWIIIAAMYVWVNRDEYTKRGVLIRYLLLGFLCVGIHTYFVPMVGSILLASSVETVIRKGQEGDKGRIIRTEVINILSFCVSGLITLFVFGGFYGASKGFGEGIGSFTANLNTFVNPLYGSIVFKPMRILYGFQYEGYAYLGLGILILSVIAAVYLIKAVKGSGLKSYLKAHLRQTVGLCLFVVNLFIAVFPTAAINDFRIIGIPLGQTLGRILGVFRSNGRFIWTCVYLIYLCALVCFIRLIVSVFDKRLKGRDIILKMVIVAVLFQVLDFTPIVKEKQGYFMPMQAHINPWEGVTLSDGDKKYDEFVFLYNENDIIMDTAYFAYLNGAKLNNFYYARPIDDEVNANIAGWLGEVRSGKVRDDVVYICRNEDYEELSPYTDDLTWHKLDKGHMAGVK
ncbi:MAG: DUF6311 domain-containing protein [Lachnospiraceae bacterium]|nr:DUF6311 domain-containing protein [Lachnospiraceae bacterium]